MLTIDVAVSILVGILVGYIGFKMQTVNTYQYTITRSKRKNENKHQKHLAEWFKGREMPLKIQMRTKQTHIKPDYKDDPRPFNVRDEFRQIDRSKLKDFYQSMASQDEIAAINISGNINLAVIIRTASLFGIKAVNILGRKRYDKRGSIGQDNYLESEFIPAMMMTNGQDETLDDAKIIEYLTRKAVTHTVVLLEQWKYSVKLHRMRELLNAREKKPVFFVAGNEGQGISHAVIEAVHEFGGFTVEIPQKGLARSHNVSISMGMVLWEYFRESFD
mgnify:CR=1 FL=1